MKKKKQVKKRPFLPPMSFSYEGSQASKTGTWRYLTPAYLNKLAPCNESCPAGEDVEAAMVLAGQEDYLGAWEKITQENPLPRVCGRVCFHPCEAACNRKEFDEATSINALERFVGDQAFQSGKRFPPPQEKKREKVAIIGSGPAGLSCAYYLALMGYRVTIFEKLPEPGGMAAVGIPDYRLPREVLRAEIGRVEALGAEIKYNTRFGVDVTMEQLFEQGYEAVFVAVGAHQSARMGCEGEDAGYQGFMPGVEFLREIAFGNVPLKGRTMLVIGGGNVAMDCVRSSRRIGFDDVKLLYRRTEAEMPADQVEIVEAKEEGVEMVTLVAPTKIIAEDGVVKGLECLPLH